MRHTERPRVRSQDESGVALILAIVFLTVASVVTVAIANQATSSLASTNSLVGTRSNESGADSALEAAVQLNRYNANAFACSAFPGATSIQIGTRYIAVACSGTPMQLQAKSGSDLLTSVGFTISPPQVFVSQDVGQSVVSATPNAGVVPSGTTISSFSSETSVVMSSPATQTGLVTIGTQGQRVVAFWACAEQASFASASCSATNAAATAVVLYGDTDTNGNPHTGFSMTIESWDVTGAHG